MCSLTPKLKLILVLRKMDLTFTTDLQVFVDSRVQRSYQRYQAELHTKVFLLPLTIDKRLADPGASHCCH